MEQDLNELFLSIRDIPYRIPLAIGEEDHSCVGKNQKLKDELSKRGFDVRWRVCKFRWSDLSIPKRVLAVPHEDDAEHAYLEVKIDDKWKVIDASWDGGLKNSFRVEEWDGVNDTQIAVPCMLTFSPEESAEIMMHLSDEALTEDLKRNAIFYKALNDWMESSRSASTK